MTCLWHEVVDWQRPEIGGSVGFTQGRRSAAILRVSRTRYNVGISDQRGYRSHHTIGWGEAKVDVWDWLRDTGYRETA